jgi:hypothetical protein
MFNSTRQFSQKVAESRRAAEELQLNQMDDISDITWSRGLAAPISPEQTAISHLFNSQYKSILN